MDKQLTLPKGERVRQLREAAGMTQEKLSHMSNLDRRTIQRAEQGVRLQIETLSSLAAALQVPVSDIIAGDEAADDVDELRAKSLVVLNRIRSGITLLNIVCDSYWGTITCEADPTPDNVEALTGIVGKLEELMPQPWHSPADRPTLLQLSQRLRTAVQIGEQLKFLEEKDVAFFGGTYTARTQVPWYDGEVGEMVTTTRTPYELVTMSRVVVAPRDRGERITIKANDIYVPQKPPPFELPETEGPRPREELDDQIPF